MPKHISHRPHDVVVSTSRMTLGGSTCSSSLPSCRYNSGMVTSDRGGAIECSDKVRRPRASLGDVESVAKARPAAGLKSTSNVMMQKNKLAVPGVVLALFGAIAVTNYLSLARPLQVVIAGDSRNHGISATAHYEYYVVPSSIVFDLEDVGSNNSMADVTRVLLQYSATLRDREYSDVTLAHAGVSKFKLDGKYFHQLGADFDTQNPIYTIRTLPENVMNLDGSHAFSRWEGGWLGVFGKQMDDFNEFHKQWYVADMSKNPS